MHLLWRQRQGKKIYFSFTRSRKVVREKKMRRVFYSYRYRLVCTLENFQVGKFKLHTASHRIASSFSSLGLEKKVYCHRLKALNSRYTAPWLRSRYKKFFFNSSFSVYLYCCNNGNDCKTLRKTVKSGGRS